MPASRHAGVRVVWLVGGDRDDDHRQAMIDRGPDRARSAMRDDEVTVVADVFGNGLAQIAEVVVTEAQRPCATKPRARQHARVRELIEQDQIVRTGQRRRDSASA